MIENFQTEFVCGTQFQGIADYVIGPDRQDRFVSTNETKVIWCRPDFLNTVFEQCRSLPDCKFILITHCSDYEINYDFFSKKPPNIIKWFAQNISYSHPDLHCIPIGLESNQGPYKGAYTNFKWLFENIKPEPISNKIINKIYCNFNPQTHPNRKNVLHTLVKNNLCAHEFNINYENYCNSIKKFLFVASPRGNGLDCHRTWETLYLGSVPIVEKSLCLEKLSKDLPILILNDWNDTNELQEKMKYFINLYKNKQAFLNLEKLKISYWQKIITSYK